MYIDKNGQLTSPTVEELNVDDLVKLDEYHKRLLFKGALTYIEHPTKGLVYADNINIFINTIELTEEEKLLVKQK